MKKKEYLLFKTLINQHPVRKINETILYCISFKNKIVINY